MNRVEFDSVVSEADYQVLFFSTPLPIPLSFAVHTWFVTIELGDINRWEVWQFPNRCPTSWGHVHLNLFKPWAGLRIIYFQHSILSKSSLICRVKGGKDSLAHKMIEYAGEECPRYTQAGKYRYVPGPNSNTFVQWYGNRFPEAGLTLPARAIGKGYISARTSH